MSKKMTPWLVGILLTTLFFGVLYLIVPFEYEGPDDYPILRSFMGYEGGVPASFHLYVHTGFAWLLYGLAMLFPGIAWFSILQLVLLWFSCVVIVKSTVQCAVRQRLSLWAGALVGLLFLLAFATLFICRITYTVTSALVGAAAVAQLLSIDCGDASSRQILRSMLLSIALLLCAYSLRQITVLAPLAFWCLALCFMAVRHFRTPFTRDIDAPFRPLKSLLIGALTCALCFGVLAGIRFVEIKALHMEDFLRWQRARINVFDYTSFATDTDPESVAELGWSMPQYDLMLRWYLMDANITAEALEKLYALQPNANLTLSDRLPLLSATLGSFLADEPRILAAMFFLPLAAFFCIFHRNSSKGENRWIWRSAVAVLLLAAVLLCYLAAQGRLPLRAAVNVTLPASVFMLMLMLAAHGEQLGHASKLSLRLFAAAFLLCFGFAVFQTGQSLYTPPPEDPDEVSVYDIINADLDAFALENPDVLIIYDTTLLHDRRLFPDTSEGIPGNVLFWGGWPTHAPSWNHQLAVYGLDGDNFTASDFLRENVVLASGVYEPRQSLLNYIAESVSGEVYWDFYGEYGYLYFFSFFEAEE